MRASDSVELIGRSGLFTQTLGTASAGNLTIATRRLSVQNGAVVSATTFGEGQGGTLVVRASDSVELVGSGGLFTQTEGAGAAGNLTVETERLSVQNGAQVSVNSAGSGNAGNLEVRAHNLSLDNQGYILAINKSGNGGDITLRAGSLQLRHNSNINTNAGGTATGGNITLNTDILVTLENSDISANAEGGPGGRVVINAQGIFGTEGRKEQTLTTSDITATSELGPQFNGTVEITTPDVDPSRGLVALPTKLVDVTGLIASGCPGGGGDVGKGSSELIITGRGGLPPNPSEALSSDTVWSDLRYRTKLLENRTSSKEAAQQTLPTAEQLVEAQGWMINNKGEVVLTNTASTLLPHIPWLTPATCHTP